MTWTWWVALGAIFGALGVGIGAFGAHGLQERLEPHALQIFETGARYQMYHALALLACGFVALRIDNVATRVAGCAFTLGILLFSGSLYALAITGVRWLGAVTPLGGVGFIVGWLALAVAALRPGA